MKKTITIKQWKELKTSQKWKWLLVSEHIEGSWKNISEENCDMMKLYTTLTAINLIIESLISSFVHAQDMRVCIKKLPNSSNEASKWEVLNLEMDNIQEMSDSAKYKMAGNGVVVDVVEDVIKHILL